MYYFLMGFFFIIIFQAIYLNKIENDQEIIQMSGHPQSIKSVFSVTQPSNSRQQDISNVGLLYF